MKKRILSLVLALTMLVSLLPAGVLGVSAADSWDYTGVEYNFKFLEVSKELAKRATPVDDMANADLDVSAEAEAVGSAPWTYVGCKNSLFKLITTVTPNAVFFFSTMSGTEGKSLAWTDKEYLQIEVEIEKDGAYVGEFSQFLMYQTPAIDVFVAPSDAENPMAEQYLLMHVTNVGRPTSGCNQTTTVTEGDKALYLTQGSYCVTFVRNNDLEDKANRRYAYVDSFSLLQVDVPATVDFTEKAVEIAVGDMKTVEASVAPADVTVTYTSSNENVVMVDSETGLLIANEAGVATVTATVDGMDLSDSYTVVVHDTEKDHTFKFDELYTVAGIADFKDLTEDSEERMAAMETAGSDPWAYVDRYHATAHNDVFFRYLPDTFDATYLFNSTLSYGDTGDWYRLKVTVDEDGKYVGKVNYRSYNLAAGAELYLAPVSAEDPMADEYKLMTVSNRFRTLTYTDVVAMGAEGMDLNAGDYYLTLKQVDDAGENYRYFLMHEIDLLYAGAPSVASISISGASATMKNGATAELSATVLPQGANQNVTWSSSDEDIAEVSDTGVVTAKASGNVVITAAAQDGSDVSDSVEIFVISDVPDYDYQFKAVGVALMEKLGSGNMIANKDLFLDNYEGSSIVAESAPWSYLSAGTLAYLGGNYANLGVFTFSTPREASVPPTDYTVLKIQIAEDGKYIPSLTYNLNSAAAGANVYLAPISDNANKDAAKYLILEASNKNRPTDGSVVKTTVSSETALNLAAGEYYLTFEETNDVTEGTYRYLYLDNFALTQVGTFTDVEKLSAKHAKDELLAVGDTANVTATVTGDDTDFVGVTWSSSNEDVITVAADGNVTAVGNGFAYAIATVGEVSDKVPFFVTDSAAAYDYKFKEVGKAIAVDGVGLLGKIDAKNPSQVQTYEASQPEGVEGTAPWYFVDASTNMFRYLGVNDKYGTFMFNAKAGSEFVTIKIKLSDTAEYAGAVLHNQTSYSMPTNIYFAPAAEVDAGASTTDAKYLFIATDDMNHGNTAPASGYETVSEESRLLTAGEYYVTFKQNWDGVDPEQRYFYPTNMQLYKVGDGLATTAGASIRVREPQGLRFMSQISKSVAADVVEYGTILMPTEDLDGDVKNLVAGYTKGTHEALLVPAAITHHEDAANIYFTAVIYDIPTKYYGRSITARAYAKLSDGTYIYGSTSSARSILEVAQNGLASGTASAREIEVFEQIIADAE